MKMTLRTKLMDLILEGSSKDQTFFLHFSNFSIQVGCILHTIVQLVRTYKWNVHFISLKQKTSISGVIKTLLRRNLFPGLRSPLERFRRHLSESNEELEPLKVWQMQALSMQAAVAVVDANDAGGDESLKVLTSIAQNFPMQVSE